MKKIKQSIKSWIYRQAIKVIAKRIVKEQNLLTPEYLLKRGWVKEGNCFIEPNIKDRDKIWIEFENHYYRVWHGASKTFIALESKEEWFELYYLCVDNDERYLYAAV